MRSASQRPCVLTSAVWLEQSQAWLAIKQLANQNPGQKHENNAQEGTFFDLVLNVVHGLVAGIPGPIESVVALLSNLIERLAAFPPNGEPETVIPIPEKPAPVAPPEPPEPSNGHLRGLEDLPAAWPALPANASLQAEIAFQ